MMPALFEYLTQDERDAIEAAFNDAEIEYNREVRGRLLDGINRTYRNTFLTQHNDPGDQLFYDLKSLNIVERLSDGTVPLAQWMANALKRFGSHAGMRALFEAKIARVTGRQRADEPMVKAQAPALQASEEVITDGIDDLLDVSFLTLGAARVPAVAKMRVPFVDGGKVGSLANGDVDYSFGTGWLIASDLLMTNYHVIRLRPFGQEPSAADLQQQVEKATAYFFQDRDGQGGQEIGVEKLLACGRTADTDYAILKLAESPKCKPLPIAGERVAMPEPVKTASGTAVRIFGVNIIQHPLGKAKRVALRNNKVYSAEYPHLYYYTDTLEGSSGSPVFDDAWRVITLHRASIKERSEYNGNKDVGYVNQGVQMNAILAHLAETAKSDAAAAKALDQIRSEQQA